MNWEAFGSIAELAGAFAVVASLFYVGAQVREGSRSTRGQTFDSIARQLNEAAAMVVEDSDLMDIGARACLDKELNEIESRRYAGYLLILFRTVQSAHHQHELGLIEQDQLLSLVNSTSAHLSNSYGQKLWNARRHLHDASFCSFVDTFIQDADRDSILKGFGIDA